MQLEKVGAASSEVVTLAEVQTHLRDPQDEDALLQSYIDSAVGQLQGRTGILRRQLELQKFKLHLPRFPFSPAAIEIPLPPLVSVPAISYRDSDGVAQTIAPENLFVETAGTVGAVWYVDTAGNSLNWPGAQTHPHAVTVEFTAGYTAADMPPPIKQAVLLTVGHWFTNREDVVTGTIATEVPNAARALVAPYRLVRG